MSISVLFNYISSAHLACSVVKFKMNIKSRNHAFTLAEAMIAVVVLAVVASSVLVPFITGANVQAEGYRRTLAAKLAGELMELIIADDFDTIVSDYNYTEPQGQVKDISGAVYSDSVYGNYSRQVECAKVFLPSESGNDEPLFIRATVKVYYQGAELAEISRLISK